MLNAGGKVVISFAVTGSTHTPSMSEPYRDGLADQAFKPMSQGGCPPAGKAARPGAAHALFG